jgi:hypothetical protein
LCALGEIQAEPPDEDDPDAHAEPPDTTTDALAAFGLKPDWSDHTSASPVEPETYWLWPENIVHWWRWQQLQTQWRYRPHGMGGAVPCGLDYAGVTAWLQAHGCHQRGRGARNLLNAIESIQACERGHLLAVTELAARAAD